MPTIDTLAEDITNLLYDAVGGKTTTLHEDTLAKFGSQAALAVQRSLQARDKGRKPRTLYMSEIGTPCKRKLWYNLYYPALAEKLLGHSKYKFLYGDLLEETTLLLAEAAGHKVEERQRQVRIARGDWTISGRIDAIIDGHLVDVKSCSTYAFEKFKTGLDDSNDSFGYRAQLMGYHAGLMADVEKPPGFLAIDKQNGYVGYFPVEADFNLYDSAATDAIIAAESPTEPPRAFPLLTDGKSGNMKLCVECSYCQYKATCWRDANGGTGLRGFKYAGRPVFLGTVVRTPNVPELEVEPVDLPEVLHADTAT